ncbi:Protein of unknown function [Oceanospirillum multiglobuliferum]|uniref:DUF2797 domain-containing protein n=1 Tax=Oceanospirillum multiglobuliferum TaxID=64969 RepID=A0A1T4LF81_9GAMM|nr:DUF2797 domain-containing protein [Oceanospirillum multiglobuliferum]OPX56681.1 hypothetical protein BTE48_01930 [Oceanospirillum multiglobuliferum]SJZ53419.1 Protein of unknown function [Oceanospirillum multiglobuliferum]
MTVLTGLLHKMSVQDAVPVEYRLSLSDETVLLNDLVGQQVTLRFHGKIFCTHCGKKTKKSYSQGFCYPCFKKLACCDLCIMSPEKCHYSAGTCREPEWGEQFCFQDHIVYLANSSGLKVGITRETQVPTRWIDQGASSALPILRVSSRLQSGLVEDLLRNHVSDRTDWRTMLRKEAEPIDLLSERDRLLTACAEPLLALQQRFGIDAIHPLPDAQPFVFQYPIEHYPTKVSALSLDKTPEITGVLQGIKGQYLILDTGVLNIRKFNAYEVELAY